MFNSGVLGIKKRNISKYIFASIFIVAASLFSSLILSTQNSHAALITKAECETAGGSFIPGNPNQSTGCNFNYSPDNQIRSYSYYTALSQCGRMGQWARQISDANATDPTKWLGGNSISVGYLVDSGDGERECNKMIRDALNLWGFSGNYTSALEEFGYERKTLPTYGQCSGNYQTCGEQGQETSWVRNSDNNTFVQAFQNGVNKRVGQGSAPSLEGRPDLLYRRSMFHIENASACSAKPFKKVSELTADERAKYPNNNDVGKTSSSNPQGWMKDYLIVKTVNGQNWSTEDWVYTLSKDNFTKLIKLNEAPSGGSIEKTCVGLAREQGDIADRVARDAASIKAAGGNPADKYGSIISTPGQSGSSSDGGGTNNSETQSASSCTVTGVGWIVCPVMTFMGGLVDAAYNFVGGLLEVQPILTTGRTAGLYAAWQTMQTIANVAFVIAFLIIIFSQLTSVGVSNYGVKKMLPRLVIAAILVNISYWISAIAVDLSNILGASMVSMFTALGNNIQIPVTDLNSGIAGEIATGSGWTGIVGTVLTGAVVGGAMYYVGLSALIPALIAALLAIITVFLVLTLRQALIILLIVVAPLAFVAYLLPNTENLFTKWRQLLTTLLLMYPIIAGIFGASSLASIIVMNSSTDTIIQIMGAAISILPLAITPVVMKTAGGLLNRFGGIVNNTEKGPFDRLRKVGDRYRERRQNTRDMKALNGQFQLGRGSYTKWRARKGAIAESMATGKKRAEQSYVAGAMTNEAGDPGLFARQMAGGGLVSNGDPAALQRALASAKFTIDKAELEDVKAEHAIIDTLTAEDMEAQGGAKIEGLKSIIANSEGRHSSARVAAAVERLAAVGDTADVANAANQYARSGNSNIVTKTLANALAANGPQSLKASDIDNIANGRMGNDSNKQRVNATFDQIVRENIAAGVYSQEKMVGASNDELGYAKSIADEQGMINLRNTARELKDNETLRGKIKHNKAMIDSLAPDA